MSDFTRAWRAKAGVGVTQRASVSLCLCVFVSLRFEAGEAFQFDWSEEGLVVF